MALKLYLSTRYIFRKEIKMVTVNRLVNQDVFYSCMIVI